jgi:hypothetical protein
MCGTVPVPYTKAHGSEFPYGLKWQVISFRRGARLPTMTEKPLGWQTNRRGERQTAATGSARSVANKDSDERGGSAARSLS